MRTLTIGFVVVIVLMAIVVPGFWMHVKQLPKDVGNSVDQSVSDSHVQGMYGSNLNKAEVELRDIYCEVNKAKSMAAEVESKLATQHQTLAREEQILKRSQEILEKNKPNSSVVVGGSTMSWEQLNQEASDRVAGTQILRKQINANEQSLAKIKKAHDYGTKAVAEKVASLRREKIDFELAKVEDAAYKAQSEIDSSLGKIYSIVGAGSADTDLQRSRKLYYDRHEVNKSKAEFDDHQTVIGGVSTTPWDKELGVADDASKKIKAYFAKP